MPVSSVYELFSANAQIEALALVDGDRPVGLITRTKLLFILSRRFGLELHARHPISTIADASPLVAWESEPLDSVIEKACARPANDIYDEILVVSSQGEFLGLLSLKELMVQQSLALARSVMQNEVAAARAQELERVSQVKSQFLANVTHELRSPVNAIIGLVNLLQMAADEDAWEKVRERLAFLLSTATNLRTVITNMLDLSKIEAGKMEVTFQTVDIVPILSEIAETARILLGEKPVSVELSVTDEAIVLETDPIKLRQIVTNLTSNAAKFTDSGEIVLAVSRSENAVEIEVRDTGLGIKEEDFKLLFSPFGQIEDAATKSHQGTGLGLAISSNLARMIGGRLSLESTYGQGSKFSLSLPSLITAA